MFTLSVVCAARANTIAPWLLDLNEPVTLVLFVETDCHSCQDLYGRLVERSPVVVVSESEFPGYGGSVVDSDAVIVSTFRVRTFPTLVVMRGSQEVIRQVEFVDLEIVDATLDALRAGRIPQTWPVGIRVGERAPGQLSEFTGLVVHWREDCDSCRREAGQVETLQADYEVAVEVVGFGFEEAEGDTTTLWSLPGAPMHVYLLAGEVMWIDTGYREDLVDLVLTIANEVR